MGSMCAKLILFAYTIVPVAIMHEAPCPESRAVSQTFMSEPLIVLAESSGWLRVRLTIDRCEGWVRSSEVVRRELPFLARKDIPIAKVRLLRAKIYEHPDIKSFLYEIPFECRFEVADIPTSPAWWPVTTADGKELYLERRAVRVSPRFIKLEEVADYAKRFIGVPYAPAGRTAFGYNEAGFVQMLYRQMGVYLPHNPVHQMYWRGFTAIPCKQAQPGDLLFFGSRKKCVSVVGVALGCGYFIYADLVQGVCVGNLYAPQWSQKKWHPYRTARTLRTKGWGDYYRSLF